MEGAAEKLDRYLRMFNDSLSTLKVLVEDPGLKKLVENVIDLAKRYYKDAEYYFEREEYDTGISCIAYAEGLLDSLKLMGYVDITWVRKRAPLPLVLVGGTFDIIHPGHVWFLQKASEYGRVVVVVARDVNVRRIKGREPVVPEKQRLEVVKGMKYVSDAVLGSVGEDFTEVVARIRPDYVVLGADQPFSERELEAALRKKGVRAKVVRLEERVEGEFYSTSSIIERIKKGS